MWLTNGPKKKILDLRLLTDELLTSTIASMSPEEKKSLVDEIVEGVSKATTDNLEDMKTLDLKVLDIQFEVIPQY